MRGRNVKNEASKPSADSNECSFGMLFALSCFDSQELTAVLT
jgi:hypothetical protein